MKTGPDRSLQILIVEDNRTQAEYLRHLLEKKGHQVTVSNNGYEALEKLELARPDIILTDVMMPDMDGFTLCKTIKSNEIFRDIPVILVTHLYSPVDVIKGLEAGADNFIIKPYDPEYIFSRIAGIMQAKEHPGPEESNPPLDVVFSSEVHTIASSRMQILNILLSTYETAVKNNSELQVAHERLHYTNAQLQKLVEDLEQTNESLHLKNLERGRLETALNAAQQKIETLSEALRLVCQTRLHPAEELLLHQISSSTASQEITDAVSHLHAGLVALTNSRQYLKAATGPRTWLGIRNGINAAVEPVRRQTIRYENLIPEDIEYIR
jgi:CheY-like chemotaxis protein